MDKQQIEEILNNAPSWSDEAKVKKGRLTTIYGNSGELDYQIHNLSDLQTQLDQLNEIECLKSTLKLARKHVGSEQVDLDGNGNNFVSVKSVIDEALGE